MRLEYVDGSDVLIHVLRDSLVPSQRQSSLNTGNFPVPVCPYVGIDYNCSSADVPGTQEKGNT